MQCATSLQRCRDELTAIVDPDVLRAELVSWLAQDATFAASQILVCSEPGFICSVLFQASQAPLIGYFGVVPGFMLQEHHLLQHAYKAC